MKSGRKILAIDDDANNLEIIEGFLKFGENTDHNIIKCKSAQEGFKLLVEKNSEIDLILLDRMMPNMSGVDFLKMVNKDEILKKIPVIMQTASNEKEHVVEGYKSGVYQYLVKPFSPIVFNSMVRSAIDFYTRNKVLSAEVEKTKHLFTHVTDAVFEVRSLVDIDSVSVSLALLFPNPDKVLLGISEILINALEHGNLNISYEEKTNLNKECKWKNEITKRLNEPENKNKKVIITYSKKEKEIILNIKDSGEGFDFNQYLEFTPSRSGDNHGRGIAFARNLCFDKLEYIGRGNEVNCIVHIVR